MVWRSMLLPATTQCVWRLLRHDADRRRQRVCQCERVFSSSMHSQHFCGSILALPGARSIARTLSALKEEADAGQIGGDLVAGKLAEILIIEAVRSYISSAPVANVGWITALGDARVAKAIRLMHDDVARRWTIDALAREIGMSRSALTLRFSQRVGRAPMDYLTRWRMVLAQRHLANGAASRTWHLPSATARKAPSPTPSSASQDIRQEGYNSYGSPHRLDEASHDRRDQSMALWFVCMLAVYHGRGNDTNQRLQHVRQQCAFTNCRKRLAERRVR